MDRVSLFSLVFSLVVFCKVLAAEEIPLKFIDWENIEEKTFFDIGAWKSKTIGIEIPNWRQVVFKNQNKTPFGLVVKCVGECQIYRGAHKHRPRNRSFLYEGDQFDLGDQSYAWIFTFAGQLIRLSPQSSLSFLECHYNSKKFFSHVRLNSGHLYWSDRLGPPEDTELIGTDPLFDPLLPLEANLISTMKTEMIKKGSESMAPLDEHRLHVQYARKLYFENQESGLIPKTETLFSFPKGEILAKNAKIQLGHLLGQKTFFSLREGEGVYYTRLGTNYPIERQNWYQIEKRDMKKLVKTAVHHHVFDLLVRRPTGIQIVRELWLRRYSFDLFSRLSEGRLPNKRWAILNWSLENSELRKQFLMRDVQTKEARALSVLTEIRSQFDEVVEEDWSELFFDRALEAYIRELSGEAISQRQKMLYDLDKEITFWALEKNFVLQ